MAHARRRFVELQTANLSMVAVGALELIRQLYDIEREVCDASPEQRSRRGEVAQRRSPSRFTNGWSRS